jgi:dolichol-phosphate mannosyltransferase
VSSDVLVVLPTYNEAQNLPRMAEELRRFPVDVLVVDDGSPDGTGDLAEALAAQHDRVHVLQRTTKEGLGPAYAAGFAWGLARGARTLCEMDADFSHDPDDLPRLLEAVAAGADLAIGSRYVPGGGVEGWSRLRLLLSRLGNWYARKALGTPVKDATAGFRAYRADLLQRLEPGTCQASGYGFQIEMTMRAHDAGARIEEVPIVFSERLRGESKMTVGIALEAILLVTRWGFARRFGKRERR